MIIITIFLGAAVLFHSVRFQTLRKRRYASTERYIMSLCTEIMLQTLSMSIALLLSVFLLGLQ
jgi:hypothetical protein